MIQIPTDAKCLREDRLTAIEAIKTLADKTHLGAMIAAVKTEMQKRRATYAASDLVIAHLRPGGSSGTAGRRTIDAHKLYELVKQKKITLEDFLKAVSVRIEPLSEFLSERDIDAIAETAPASAGHGSASLFTEFKQGVLIEPAKLQAGLLAAVKLSKAA